MRRMGVAIALGVGVLLAGVTFVARPSSVSAQPHDCNISRSFGTFKAVTAESWLLFEDETGTLRAVGDHPAMAGCFSFGRSRSRITCSSGGVNGDTRQAQAEHHRLERCRSRVQHVTAIRVLRANLDASEVRRAAADPHRARGLQQRLVTKFSGIAA